MSVRERSSSHSLYPAPHYPGGTSASSSPRLSLSPSTSDAPHEQAPQSRSRSSSYSPHPMLLQPGSGQSPPCQSLSPPVHGAYPNAPNAQAQKTRSRSSSYSTHPTALQPGSGSSSHSHSPSSGANPDAPRDESPQTRSRSGSFSPHPIQLQPGSRPSSRPHSPSLSFTGADELHFGDQESLYSSSQPSPASYDALPPALYQTTPQLSLHPQGANTRPSVSRERSPSYSGGYAPYVAPLQPKKLSSPGAPAPADWQQSPEPSFNACYPSDPPPPKNQAPPTVNNSFCAPPALQYPPSGTDPLYPLASDHPGAPNPSYYNAPPPTRAH